MSNNERHVVPFWVKLPWHHLTSFSPTCHKGNMDEDSWTPRSRGREGERSRDRRRHRSRDRGRRRDLAPPEPAYPPRGRGITRSPSGGGEYTASAAGGERTQDLHQDGVLRKRTLT